MRTHLLRVLTASIFTVCISFTYGIQAVSAAPTVVENSQAFTSANISSVIMQGSYAYVTDTNGGFLIYDSTDPENLELLSSTRAVYSMADVAVEGNYAYVANTSAGVAIYDISSPEQPQLVSILPTTYAANVQIDRDTLYIGDNSSGFKIADVSDKVNPSIVGSFATYTSFSATTMSIRDFAIDGNYAYLVDYNNGFIVLDISNPQAMTDVLRVNIGSFGTDVELAGTTAYVGIHTTGVTRVDVTTPTAAFISSIDPVQDRARALTVGNGYIYVADYQKGLTILDQSTGNQVGTVDADGDTGSIVLSGDYAFLGDDSFGLYTVDVSDVANPTVEARIATGSMAQDVVVDGDYAYIADYLYALRIVDISDKDQPELVSYVQPSGFAHGVTKSGDYVYLSSYIDGVHVVEVSDPTNPNLIATYNSPGRAYETAVSGNTLFIADEQNGVEIVDITNPGSPTFIANYNTVGEAFGVAVDGNELYVADYQNDLVVLDISTLSTPTLLSSTSVAGSSMDIAVQGDYAYIATKARGMAVVNVSNPSAPSIDDTLTLQDWGLGISVEGNYAYVATRQFGMEIVDVSDSTAIELAGEYSIDGAEASSIAVEGDYIYTAGDNAGLTIHEITDRDDDADDVLASADCDDTDPNASVEVEVALDSDGNGQYDGATVVIVCENAIPANYILTSTSTIDPYETNMDGDSEVMANDCDDTDASAQYEVEVALDADGDGDYDATTITTVCENAIPAGYVLTSSGSVDPTETDVDGDQVVMADDCDDADSSVFTEVEVAEDADEDGYHNPSTVHLQCTVTAASGMILVSDSLGEDSDDTDPLSEEPTDEDSSNDEADIGGDTDDEAGRGGTDTELTVNTIKRARAGQVKLIMSDGSTNVVKVFSKFNKRKKTTVQYYRKRDQYFVYHPKWKKVVALDGTTGEEVDRKKISKKKFKKGRGRIIRMGRTRYLAVQMKKKKQSRAVFVRLDVVGVDDVFKKKRGKKMRRTRLKIKRKPRVKRVKKGVYKITLKTKAGNKRVFKAKKPKRKFVLKRVK
jgi:hypothetical protein